MSAIKRQMASLEAARQRLHGHGSVGTLGLPVRESVPVLNDNALYFTDNGAVYCGRHCGASARYTGRDISGQQVAKVTADDAAQARRDGWEIKCEKCGAQYGQPHVAPKSVDLLGPIKKRMRAEAERSPKERYDTFVAMRGLPEKEIPARGFCISRTYNRHLDGAGYAACFLRKPDARMAAKLLARAEGHPVQIIQVQNRGEDRFIVEEVKPR